MDRRSFLGTALATGAWWALEQLASAAELAPLAEIRPAIRFPWAWSVNLNIRAMTEDLLGYLPYLDLAAALGVGLVRFDVYWRDLEPRRGAWLDDRLRWRVGLVEAACQRGLGLVVNLSGYPSWALSDLAGDREAFYTSWRSFVGRVGAAAGDRVAFYQLDNEFNTVLDPIPADQDVRIFIEAARALDALGVRHPRGQARTVINPFYGFDQLGSDWTGALASVLPAAAAAVDVLALDYYPGSYDFWNDPGDWAPLVSLAGYAERYDMLLAVGETGCPSYLLGDGRQSAWFARAMSGLARQISELDLARRFTYVNLFELVDRPPLGLWEFWRPTEVTLGLARRDLRPKQAFYELERLIASRRPLPPATLATPGLPPPLE